jgi:hypothetical protein
MWGGRVMEVTGGGWNRSADGGLVASRLHLNI